MKILNICSFVIITSGLYYSYSILEWNVELYSLILSFIVSFTLSNLASNRYKFSQNKYIKFLQKFVIYNFICFVLTWLFIIIILETSILDVIKYDYTEVHNIIKIITLG